MNLKISAPLCYSALGLKPNQEDCLYPLCGQASANTRVFMVCDGMGGHEDGEVASSCVAATIGRLTDGLSSCTTSEMQGFFEQALEKAYAKLDALDTSISNKKMGTTLTFLALCTDGILVAHIGDSRVYQLRPGKGILFVTRDHSLVNDLLAAGEITEEQAKSHPQRNVITRAVQPHQDYPAKATYNVLPDVKKGDLFFLCCDGVLEKMDDNDLCRHLLDHKSLVERIQSVERTCKARNTRDNNSSYLIEIKKVENDAGKRSVRLLWILLVAILGALAVASIIHISNIPSQQNQNDLPDPPQSEQTQGPIKRQGSTQKQ